MATDKRIARRLVDMQARYRAWYGALIDAYPAQENNRHEYAEREKTAGLGRVRRDLGGTTDYHKDDEVLVWEPRNDRLRASHWIIFEPSGERLMDALVPREDVEVMIMPADVHFSRAKGAIFIPPEDLVGEFRRYAAKNRSVTIAPYTFARWADEVERIIASKGK